MAWYIGQSIPMMVIAFLVGLLVGYLIWGRRYRRLEQAEVVRAVDPATVLPFRGSAPAAIPAPDPIVEEPAHVEPIAAPATEPVAHLADVPATPDAPDDRTDTHDAVDAVDAVADDAHAADGTEPPTAAEIAAESDRLERIEGIGPKIALALRTAGIRTFEQLAGTEATTLRDALADANLRFAPSLSTWAAQARLLADGDHEGHAALTEQLVAGRAPKAN